MEKKWYHNQKWHIELTKLLEETGCTVVHEEMHPDNEEIVGSSRMMFHGDEFIWILLAKTKGGHVVQFRWDQSHGFQYSVDRLPLIYTSVDERFVRQFKWEVEYADKH